MFESTARGSFDGHMGGFDAGTRQEKFEIEDVDAQRKWGSSSICCPQPRRAC